MAKLVGAQRLVLHAITSLPTNDAGYVTDVQIGENTKIPIGEVRDWIETLGKAGYVEHARTEDGLVATSTPEGRLTLSLDRGPSVTTNERQESKPAKVGAAAIAGQSPNPAASFKGLRAFDKDDAKFFLDLLPGSRGPDGLPESVRFWKFKIEETDPERTFRIGVIYGPSGCGKSSLMEAGILPNLADSVNHVYLQATADDTEHRLLNALRRRYPLLPPDSSLASTLENRDCIPNRRKLLIILDQFEQWLHIAPDLENTELLKALKTCDGQRLQCILMVRDDYWMPITRFMKALGSKLSEGMNMQCVDLFDPPHARKVLAIFGQALRVLMPDLSEIQRSFVNEAIKSLGSGPGSKVVAVQLALFAQMMKGKEWTSAILKEVGGFEGVGVTFLEESFSSSTAPPQHRQHRKAAQATLKCLLPEPATDIRGQMRSQSELLEASGYAGRVTDFHELVFVLDDELRLITPTDPGGKVGSDDSASSIKAGEKYYQLTHDYLVPSLREWLTRKQRETRKGRAELRLAERSALWNAKPENQQLPSLWELLNIRLLTDRMNWTEPQRKMMGQAGRVQGIRSGIVAAVLVVASVTGMSIHNAVVAEQARIRVENLEKQNATRVDGLVKADIAQVPAIITDLAEYRAWADPLLKAKFEKSENGSVQQLHSALALLPVDESKVDYLRDRLIVVTPQQFPVVRDALLAHQTNLIEPLWSVALDTKYDTPQRFQAACALATYSLGDERWSKIRKLVADHLVTLQASEYLAWREALKPAKGQLIKPLATIYRDKSQREQNRIYATETLADYAADRPDDLFDLLADAERFQFPVIFGKLAAHQEKAVVSAQAELAESVPEQASEDDKEALAQRQANAAIALLKLGTPGKVWPLLLFSSDPRVRSYLIHSISPLGGDPQTIIQRLDSEPDVTTRRALVLTLGEFTDTQLPVAQRQALLEKLLAVYENEPDAGLHAAAEWLLRKWEQGTRLKAVLEKLQSSEEKLQARKATDKRQWYVNTQGQTFVIVDADEFVMGSPESEPDHQSDETRHRRRIGRRLAISSMEVTKAQYRKFQEAVRGFDLANNDSLVAIVRTDDSPQTAMTWYEAAYYCNWLSETEGIRKDQWCYEPNEKEEYGSGMKAKERHLELSGYRLPTEAEWEYACRAGTVTSRYYGLTETLLPQYAWYQANGRNQTWPVGSLKPNDFGLFDMQGNAFEWCDGLLESFPKEAEKIFEDSAKSEPVTPTDRRVLRGGAFNDLPGNVRSAYRLNYPPDYRSVSNGFRPARTYP